VPADDQSCQLQMLLDRARAGDEQARVELVGRAHDRLERLTRTILHKRFGHLRGDSETASILDQTALELMEGLESCEIMPSDVPAFFRDAARLIRNALRRREYLLSKVTHATVPSGESETRAAPGHEPAAADADPTAAAMWSEFHDKVERLPDDLRRVVDLRFYHGLTEAEIAHLVGISQPQVSRLWTRAVVRLRGCLPDATP
jgi:RNA polymerase sigma factor (sigma-70 family)